MWDLGGQNNLRQAWDAYFQKTQGVIYVIDASEMNQDQILSSKMEFHNMLMSQELANASVLVFANKSDLPGSKSTDELIEIYNLNVTTHDVQICECSALTGAGLQEGLDWLAQRIQSKKSFLGTEGDEKAGNVSARGGGVTEPADNV